MSSFTFTCASNVKIFRTFDEKQIITAKIKPSANGLPDLIITRSKHRVCLAT